jgi:phosphoglycerol transferase MdoB-like AlkP superfamily enzyme
MNRFPIWKGNRIGRYDDRLILRSVIFFALIITALSVFMIRLTEGNILLRVFLLFLIVVLCLLDLLYHDRYPEPSGNVADAAGKPMV